MGEGEAVGGEEDTCSSMVGRMGFSAYNGHRVMGVVTVPCTVVSMIVLLVSCERLNWDGCCCIA